jgi:hypothetical protein
MNAPTPQTPQTPALFTSVRSSKDRALAGFAGAVLVAFALHAGAFLPQVGAAEATERGSVQAAAAPARAPAQAVMARHRALRAARVSSGSCPAPRG